MIPNLVSRRERRRFSRLQRVQSDRRVAALPEDYFDKLDRMARDQAQTVIDSAKAKLTNTLDESISVTSDVLAGSPRAAILEEADRWKADLIVMGLHGYGVWQRFLLGSVSQAVVSHANCSVEVVHRKDESNARAA